MPGFDVAIMTCERTPHHLDRMLTSLCTMDFLHQNFIRSIHIMIDTSNEWFLADYKGTPRVHLHYLTPEQDREQQARPTRSRIYLTLERALAVPSTTSHFLLFEDDVLFRADWIRHLRTVVSDLHDPFALALYSVSRREAERYHGPYTQVLQKAGAGLCGWCLSRGVKDRVPHLNCTRQAADGDFIARLPPDVARLALLRDIVQHNGHQSTGPVYWDRGSPSFSFPFAPLTCEMWLQDTEAPYEGGFEPRRGR